MSRDRFKKVYIEITNVCNLNCDFCIKTNREKHSLTTNEFTYILDKVKPYTKYLYFHVLGEPLIHKNINEFIDIASKDFYINITTNGYLINNIRAKNIRQVNISLHSFNEKYHKKLNDYLNDVCTYALNNNDNTYINFRLWATTKYYDEIINYLEKRFNTNIENRKNTKLANNIYINFSNEFIWPEKSNSEVDINTTCYALIDHIAVLSDGSVVPCCLDASGVIKLGNIFSDKLEDIFKSDLFNELLDGFKNNKRIHPLCKKCNFLESKIKN